MLWLTSRGTSEFRAARSRKSSERPDPELLIDRSLGRYAVADALRAHGLVVHTLASIYGEDRAQRVADHEWLELAGRRSYLVLMKDKLYRLEENRAALLAHGVRAFCLTSRGLRGDDQARIFVEQRHRILQRGRKPGPFVYGVYRTGLRPLWLPPSG